MDPKAWSEMAHRVVELVSTSVASARARQCEVMPWQEPEERAREWASQLGEQPVELAGLLEKMVEGSTRLHHPGFVGHQVSVPDLYASLVQFVVSSLNCSSAIYEMSPAGTMMEHAVVRWMCDKVGFGSSAGGVFCSGGSLGNLTALLAMRQHKAGFDAWNLGAQGGEPLCVLVSSEAHYSVARAVRIMGWGRGGIESVATDSRRRLDPNDLAPALERAREQGRKVIGVVASVCATATGAFDPVESIADFCESNSLWLHSDGAHGASLLVSERHHGLLRGIERSDSVVWDAHKMLGVPMLSTAVLYRDEAFAAGAFAQDASYMFVKSSDEEWFSPAHKTLECTKASLAAPFFMHLATRGEAYLETHIDILIDLAQRFAAMLKDNAAFETIDEPQCNMVCFRVRQFQGTIEETNTLHSDVRQRVIREGSYYLTQADLDGAIWLRCTFMNPETTEDDLRGLLRSIEHHASEITAAPSGSPQRA